MFDRLSEDQRQAVNIVREGHNIFITGQGGTARKNNCLLLNYCKLSRNFAGAIRTTTINCRVSFIDLYLVFPRNFSMIFLPHTNTVILL